MHSSRMCTIHSNSCLLGGLPQCMLGYPLRYEPGDPPPPVWAWRPPLGVGLETPPPGVGLETPPSQTPQLPPWVWAWRPVRHTGIPPPPPGDLQGMLGYHLQCMLGYHPLPPMYRILDTRL